MTQKFSAARRAAFLRALAETGNITLSAERTKVSRSWVRLHSKDDPAFDAACREALAAAKASLDADRDERGRAPPRGWGSLDGVSLVVRGTNGRRTQIARARLKQWCPRTEDRFIGALQATCNVKAACAEVQLTPGSAYAHRGRWRGFAERWDRAEKEGYARIEAGLALSGRNLFSRDERPPDGPVAPISFDQAIQLLHMHQNQVRAIGKPMRQPRRWTFDEAIELLERELARLERGRGVSAADKARDAAEWARRRRSG